MSDTVLRPLWRAFLPTDLASAARHARSGGIAVVKARPWHLLGDAGPRDQELPPLFVDWAIRAVEAARWAEVTEGPTRGLVKATIASEWRERVGEWIARDEAFAGATSVAHFNCMKCAACCYDNRVVLDEEDMMRFRSANRKDLIRSIVRRKGVPLLPLHKTTKACIRLGKDLACTIYPVRPNMCREFPAGTEQCMTSREDLYGSPFPSGM
ncbi:MAG: hypothetical protein NVS3B20_27570 [Polyangiales bacterium]